MTKEKIYNDCYTEFDLGRGTKIVLLTGATIEKVINGTKNTVIYVRPNWLKEESAIWERTQKYIVPIGRTYLYSSFDSSEVIDLTQ